MIIMCYILVFVLFWGLSKNKFRNNLNIVMLFTFMWTFFGALSTLGLFSLQKPSITVHGYSILFVCVVDITILLFTANSPIEFTYDESASNNQLIRRSIILERIALVLVSPICISSLIVLVKMGSLSAVRASYYENPFFNNLYVDLLLRIVPINLLNALILIFIWLAFQKLNIKYLILATIDALIITFLFSGRYSFIKVIWTIIILFGFNIHNVKEKLVAYQNKVKKVFLFGAIALILITVNRNQKIIDSIYLYFSGSLSFLNYITNNPETFALNEKTYGYMTFGAITEPIVLILKALGLTTMKTPAYEFNILCQRFYNIGDGKSVYFNANTSVLYYFLRDYGRIGLVIGGVVLGGLLAKSYNGWCKGSTFGALSFIFIANVLLNSLMTYQLFGQGPIIIYIAFIFVTRNAEDCNVVGRKNDIGYCSDI